MAEKTHWPFGEDADKTHAPKKDEAPTQRLSDSAFRQQARNNRLIVGGRAHVKKQGLS